MGIISREYGRQGYSPQINIERELSVLISADRFCYMVTDPRRELLFLRNYDLSEFRLPTQSYSHFIMDLIAQDEQLKPRFEQVKLGAINRYSTLIPEDLYEPEQALLYLKNLVTPPKSSALLVDEIATIDSKNVFALDGYLKKQLEEYFPNAQMMHGNTFLIESFSHHAQRQAGNQVYVNIGHRNFQVFVFKSGQLQIANEYSFLSPNDFVYFVLLMYQQFELDPEKHALWVAGQLAEQSEIHKLLYRYLRHINWIDLHQFNIKGNYQDHPTAYFDFDLYSLHVCES